DDTGLAELQRYDYRVLAWSAGGDSGWSAVVCAKTPLSAPSALSRSAVTTSRVDLAWVEDSAIEDGLSLYRTVNDGATWQLAGTLAAGTTTFGDVSRAAGTTYGYRVRTFKGATVSA